MILKNITIYCYIISEMKYMYPKSPTKHEQQFGRNLISS